MQKADASVPEPTEPRDVRRAPAPAEPTALDVVGAGDERIAERLDVRAVHRAVGVHDDEQVSPCAASSPARSAAPLPRRVCWTMRTSGRRTLATRSVSSLRATVHDDDLVDPARDRVEDVRQVAGLVECRDHHRNGRRRDDSGRTGAVQLGRQRCRAGRPHGVPPHQPLRSTHSPRATTLSIPLFPRTLVGNARHPPRNCLRAVPPDRGMPEGTAEQLPHPRADVRSVAGRCEDLSGQSVASGHAASRRPQLQLCPLRTAPMCM